jgi:hypothetical protein
MTAFRSNAWLQRNVLEVAFLVLGTVAVLIAVVVALIT